jgi:hypothetical protein
MIIPVLSLVSNLYEPQVGFWVDHTHQMLAGINRTVFLNQWGTPDIYMGLDHLQEFFGLDFIRPNSDSVRKDPLTAWIYEKMDTFLIFKRNRLIFHFKWSEFKQKFRKSEIMM